jgi:imidazolonepropionase-like amidohydrolase
MNRMRSAALCLSACLCLASCTDDSGPPPAQAPGIDVVLFEGARLIVGDGSPPIERSAFLVEGGRFSQVGRAGELRLPPGGVRVDLNGKTVMPAIIDLHVHVGYANLGAGTDEPANYTDENVIEHLERMAYYGIGAALSMGIDRGTTAFEIREQEPPGAARLRTAGRGVAMPNAGPGAADRRDVAYGVANEAEAREAVRELAASDVDLVKIWVDDRGGTVPKLTPELYGALIDEAHAHGLRVAAHIFDLDDAKGLLRAGVDIFAHGVRDTSVDQEFLQLIAARPAVSLIPNLPESGLRTADELAYIAETIPASQVDRMRAEIAERSEPGPTQAFQTQASNLARLHAAGMRIGFGTDGSGAGWDAHEEMADMVRAGLSPAAVLAAATGVSAEILRLEELGTIGVGKSADFIVLAANPLENIRNTRTIEAVYLKGQALDRAAMRARWITSE